MEHNRATCLLWADAAWSWQHGLEQSQQHFLRSREPLLHQTSTPGDAMGHGNPWDTVRLLAKPRAPLPLILLQNFHKLLGMRAKRTVMSHEDSALLGANCCALLCFKLLQRFMDSTLYFFLWSALNTLAFFFFPSIFNTPLYLCFYDCYSILLGSNSWYRWNEAWRLLTPRSAWINSTLIFSLSLSLT